MLKEKMLPRTKKKGYNKFIGKRPQDVLQGMIKTEAKHPPSSKKRMQVDDRLNDITPENKRIRGVQRLMTGATTKDITVQSSASQQSEKGKLIEEYSFLLLLMSGNFADSNMVTKREKPLLEKYGGLTTNQRETALDQVRMKIYGKNKIQVL